MSAEGPFPGEKPSGLEDDPLSPSSAEPYLCFLIHLHGVVLG